MRTAIYLLIGVVTTIFIALAIFIIGKDKTELKEIANNHLAIANEINKNEDLKEHVYKRVNMDNFSDDLIDFGISYDVIGEYISSKTGIIELYFTSILIEDIELFHQTMNPEMLSKDLMSLDNTNKIEATVPYMNRISRNNKLYKIGFVDEKGILGIKTSNEIMVKLVYKDDYEITIPIEVKGMGESNGDFLNYVVNTSMFEVAEMIEKKR